MGRHKYTIALPVRNGGHYLKDCVASILAQTQPDFDLVILDNASTDGTAQWLASLGDSRVSIVPSASPLTIEENWARVLGISKNPYLTIIGHDDLLDPDFLATMDRLIEQHPDASLYQTHFRLIDGSGGLVRPCRPMPARESAAEYLAARLLSRRDSFGTGYVMRSVDYERVGGIPPFHRLLFADDALWISLMLPAWKDTHPEMCFSYRLHARSASGSAAMIDLIVSAQAYARFMAHVRQQDAGIDKVLCDLGGAYFTPVLRQAHWDEFLRQAAVGGAVSASFLAQLEELAAFFAPGRPFQRRPPMPYRLLELVPRGLPRRVSSRAVLRLRSWTRTAYHVLKGIAGVRE